MCEKNFAASSKLALKSNKDEVASEKKRSQLVEVERKVRVCVCVCVCVCV